MGLLPSKETLVGNASVKAQPPIFCESYVKTLLEESRPYLKEHHDKIIENVKSHLIHFNFKDNPLLYMKDWKANRGPDEKLRIPEDVSYQIIEHMLVTQVEVAITCDVSKFENVTSLTPYCKIYKSLPPGTLTVPQGQIVFYAHAKQEHVPTIRTLPGVLNVSISGTGSLPGVVVS